MGNFQLSFCTAYDAFVSVQPVLPCVQQKGIYEIIIKGYYKEVFSDEEGYRRIAFIEESTKKPLPIKKY